MQKILILLTLTVFPTLLMAQGGLRYTIQVSKFENRAGWHGRWDLGDAWGAVLTDKLQQSNEFMVIAEQDMREAAMDEQDFAASGRTAGGKKAPQTGQMTPAQLLIKGAITAFDDGTSEGGGGVSFGGVSVRAKGGTSLISGTVYVVDSTTGMVTASKEFEAKLTKKGLGVGLSKHGFHGDIGGFKKTPAGKVMEQACEEIVQFLVGQLQSISWTGTVISSGSGKIIINRGTREGVTVGSTFKVGRAEEIRDPDTGELLDQDIVTTGTIQVTEVKEKLSYCKKVSGNDPKKGDTIFQ